ncbi:MAG: phenylacetate--CoA ligase [Clostridiales bacterium]|nr:phenylacetate--CoA ligase [Clostridiales bacterium]MCF8021881.1 phenylacetate--CoA ligase [Clostridiales bacterium]
MLYWDEKHETMPREELQTLQLHRLQKTVEKVYHSVPFYYDAFKEKGLEPGDIKSLDDLKHLPFTTKQDLRNQYPYGLFSVPIEDIIRLHASSGTTGKPTVVGYTENDINIWANLIARCLVIGGGNKKSVVQNAYGYGLFTGGLGIHHGVECLGAAVVPVSGGNTQRQLMLMQDFNSNILTSTPSYALHIADEGRESGIDFESLPLSTGIFGAEPWSENMRKQLEDKLNITALDIYGLSEVMGPGVAMECPAKQGSHIFEDHFIAEVIDPDTEEPLPNGQQGELVITAVTKEALPILRYRTRDITVLDEKKCSCGRTHTRMKRVTGRTDDMLIIRGVNVFPSQVESVLLEFGETEPHYLIEVYRKGELDTMEIKVELSQNMFSDTVRNLEELEHRIRSRILSILNVSARIKFVESKSLPRSAGKAQRVIDYRKL